MMSEYQLIQTRVANYLRYFIYFVNDRISHLMRAPFDAWKTTRNRWMNMHYLGNLDPTNTFCPCAWIYCACSITTLKVFDDTSFRETSGIGMELFGLGKHAEKVMRNCWQRHYVRFQTLFPYYEVDLDANGGLVPANLEPTSMFSTHVESAGDTTEMLGSSSSKPDQVMKAYDENPKKLKFESLVKTDEEL